MTKIYTTIVVCLLVFSGNANAQSGGTYGQVPNIMTPEVATLGKYGAYPVSYYTGALNVSVPLYTIKENDISLNLALENNASGFIPNAEDGIVGLNWNLIAGGVITRQVNWTPDDQQTSDYGSGNLNSNIGYIYGMLQAKLGTYTGDYIKTLGYIDLTSHPGYPTSALQYEYSPDVFSFNFNGHTGRFFLGNDGTVKVSADQNYKVDLSGMSGQQDLTQCNPSTISITSDKGDIYTFGGDISALQISFPCTGGGTGLSGTGGVINAWYLVSIKTHNGRTITFKYEPQIPSALTSFSNSISTGFDYLYGKVFYSEVQGEQAVAGGEQNLSNAGQPPSYSIIKTAYLQSIVTPTTEIDFTYGRKLNEFYGTLGFPENHNKPSQLNNIQIKDADGNSIKNIAMVYTAYGNTSVGYRNFLSTVNFQDAYSNTISSFQFDYYNATNFPNPITKGIDLWGYYNGSDDNTYLTPSSNSGPPNYDVTFTGRDVNPSLCNMGLLKKVTYPTGGWSQFTYEGHDYSKVLRRTVQGGMTPVWFNETGAVGGARIQQVTNSNGVTQSFFYKQSYDPNDPNAANLPSSGILTDQNIFFIDCQFLPPTSGSGNRDWIIQDNNISASASYGETPIGYSEVTELVSGNGYTKYFYSTQETNPDFYDQGINSYILTPTPDPSTNNFNQQMKRLVKYSSCDLERGKLLKTAFYKTENGSSTLLREITNQYNIDPSRYSQSTIGFNLPYSNPNGFAIYHSYALYYFQNNITQQTTTEYATGSSLTSTINYSYLSNSNPLLRSNSITDSKGNVKTVNYTYPSDLSSTAPYTTMVAQNLISPVVEQDTYKNGTNLLESTKTNYNFWKGTSWDITATSGLILPQNVQTKTLNQGSYDTRFNYDAYDVQGNVTAFSKPGDAENCHVWGYHNLYPIAEVLNANLNQVAYTSFEDGDLGGWTRNPGSTVLSNGGFSGKQSFSGTIYKDVPVGNYVVTLWRSIAGQVPQVNGVTGTAGPIRGGWQLYTYILNSASHITVTVDNADELRLYPVGAQMTTYTYDLLVGVTSKTGVDNRTTYFQYDPFGRLFSVKDQDGNILKKYCYNYAGQPERCNFYASAAIDNDYNSTACNAQEYPVAYHVTVPQGRFVSYVDQSTADQQAQQYAQGLANQNGSCLLSPVSFYYEDQVGGHFTIQLHNILSQQDYFIDLEAHSDGTVVVPPGAYNIIITNDAGTGYFYYNVSCGYYDEGPSGTTFYDVDISASCNSMYID